MSFKLRRRSVAVVAVALAATLSVSACSSDETSKTEDVVAAAPLALSIDKAPDQMKIGVITSLSSRDGEGSDWAANANGAKVAAYRLGLGGTDVQLTAIDDKGDSQQAVAAVESLQKQGVAGIVMATGGDHVSAALESAADMKIPVVLPYYQGADELPDTSRMVGPSASQVGTATRKALSANQVSRPLLVNAGAPSPAGLSPAVTVGFNADTLTADVKAHVAEGEKADSVVVAGSAVQQALAVARIQAAGLNVPIILTPQARSSVFATTLNDEQGSLSTALTTVGANTGDPVAQVNSTDGGAMSAFLSAVREMASDNTQRNLVGDQSFSAVSNAADVASHDGVLALVDAAASANSTKSEDLVAALPSLRLDHANGLVGPSLDLSVTESLPDASVVTLASSNQRLGLRPDQSATRLEWFATPTS